MPDDAPPRPSALHVVAVAVLIVHEGRILSLRRSMTKDAGPGLWESLSGRVEPGEEPLDAAGREAFEESGLEVAVESRPWTTYTATRLGEPMVVIVYRATPVDDDPVVVLSDEHDAYAWLDADAFARRSSLTKLVEAVRSALGGATQVHAAKRHGVS